MPIRFKKMSRPVGYFFIIGLCAKIYYIRGEKFFYEFLRII